MYYPIGDANHQITEIFENNNQITATTQPPNPLPDITITNLVLPENQQAPYCNSYSNKLEMAMPVPCSEHPKTKIHSGLTQGAVTFN